jgi:hypothetical protein
MTQSSRSVWISLAHSVCLLYKIEMFNVCPYTPNMTYMYTSVLSSSMCMLLGWCEFSPECVTVTIWHVATLHCVVEESVSSNGNQKQACYRTVLFGNRPVTSRTQSVDTYAVEAQDSGTFSIQLTKTCAL